MKTEGTLAAEYRIRVKAIARKLDVMWNEPGKPRFWCSVYATVALGDLAAWASPISTIAWAIGVLVIGGGAAYYLGKIQKGVKI